MNQYIITTDNNADLPEEFYAQHGVPVVYLSYLIGEEAYDGTDKKQTPKEFFDAIRAGAMPVTQQVNPENAKIFFEESLKQGYDILHLAFSSGLSGTYNSTRMAAEELREEYPDANIIVIDTLCASMGQGFLLAQALARKAEGMEMQALAQWVEEHKLHVAHEVVADDLFHLQRGGRVSKTAAVFGSALGVKPIIHVDDEGKLIPFSKQRGKAAGLRFLVDNLVKKIDADCKTVFICHSDCLEDAQSLEQMIREKTDVQEVVISYIGPTIGAHTGVGTVAVFYFTETRAV